MAVELRVEALPPVENNVLGVPEITIFAYEFGLYWLGGDAVRFDDLRIRTFMYHHFASTTGQEASYGPDISSGAPPIVLNRGSAQDVNVSWEWDSWQTDVKPPRIDNTLSTGASFPLDPAVPDRYLNFAQEITLYPGRGTNEQLDAVNPTATGAQVSYAGQIGDATSTTVKFGRFNDVKNSYSYLSPLDNGGSVITSPYNYVLEQKSASFNIQSINQVGTTVTVTTTTSHGFLVGEGVTISDVISTQGLVYNGNFKVTSVPSANVLTYESRSFLTPQPGNLGTVEKWIVVTGDVPSSAVAVNYNVSPVTPPVDHTTFTTLTYAEKDTSISESNGVPLESTQWGISATIPVQNYSAGGSTEIKKSVWRFPVTGLNPSTSYKSEINFYNVEANTGGVTFDLFPMTSSNWTELTLATGTWSFINPLINETTPIDTYLFDTNSNQVDEFTYTKFDIDSSIVSNWIDGSSVPDVALVKRPDLIFGEYFYVTEDSASEPFVELRPFIVISGDQSVSDSIPPTLSLTNTTSNVAIINASGDGAGTITYEVADASTIQTSDIINVSGTGIYDGANLTVTGVSGTDITVTITGNTETSAINAGIINTPSVVTVSVQAVDNEEIDATPANINIDKTLALTPVPAQNIVKNIPSTMTFDFVLEDIDDGYYQVQVQDVAGNLSPILTDPILMEVSAWDGVNPPVPNPDYVRTNDQILVTGFNVESFTNTFKYVSGDTNDGGLNVAPVPVSIGSSNLQPSLNGFNMLVPANQSKEFAITSINESNNTFSVSSAVNLYVGLPVTFAYKDIIQDPIVVGQTYYISSVSYTGTTAIIKVSETLGGSDVNLVTTANVGQMYLYNKETTLHVIRDGIDSSSYSNIVKFNVDDFGPILTVPSITAPNTTIQVLASDPSGINPSDAVVTFGTITGSSDISPNSDGTVYLFDVDVGPTSGTLRFTVRDELGNERFQEQQIPITSDVFIEVLDFDIINQTSFTLRVQVVTETVPSQIATGPGDPGVFVADSIDAPYGSINNLISTVTGLQFDLVVNSVGDGIFKIWASDGITTDTLTPIVITSITPECANTDDVVTTTGANLGYPGMTASTTTGEPITLITQTMTTYQVRINGTVEGLSNFVLTNVIDGDNVSSNEVFFTIDNTPPVIDILGDEIITLVQNSGPYVDQGAVAIDQLQGSVPVVTVGADLVDVSSIGTYDITYTADDGCGNISTETRVVNVVTGCSLSLGISPTKGMVGDIVTIFAIGDTFNPISTENIVTFNGVLGQVVGGTLTTLEVQVPNGATTGDVQVETQDPDCGISNPVNFTVVFQDEEFPTGEILNTLNSRNDTTQGNVSIFGFRSLRSAIYNRDYAYSDFTEVVDENSMIQNVATIVLTKQGERIMNPDFGTTIHTDVFRPVDDIVDFEQNVLSEINRAVQIYEPRVVIDLVQSIARFNPNTNELQILLSIIVPTGTVRELGLTLSSVVKVDL